MTAAGDAVLAVARGEVGYVEGPGNSTKYWEWWGYNLGPWCGVFVSWCYAMAGFPHCDVDGSEGFVLVSNGTAHSYNTSPEAQPTFELEPGDTVLFSWYSWHWENGVPVCSDYPYTGMTAGDHTGIFAYWIDRDAGSFACVEGNTSSSSYDNGGMVLERTDRHISQVCGWWRPPTIAGSAQPEDEMTEADFARIQAIVHDEVVNVWRAQEMSNLDTDRAQRGAHEATLGVVRSDEYANIVESAVRRATQ